MEKPRRAHGRAHHQRGAGDAPGGVPRGPQAGSVEGDLRVRGRLRPARDALRTHPGETGESPARPRWRPITGFARSWETRESQSSKVLEKSWKCCYIQH